MQGILIQCSCGERAVPYWVKDVVWQQAEHAAPPRHLGGHLCVGCAGKAIGRELTLADLDVAAYARMTPKNGQQMMKDYVRATIVGAFNAVYAPIPANWSQPAGKQEREAAEIGRELASHTENPRSYLPGLATEVDRLFP